MSAIYFNSPKCKKFTIWRRRRPHEALPEETAREQSNQHPESFFHLSTASSPAQMIFPLIWIMDGYVGDYRWYRIWEITLVSVIESLVCRWSGGKLALFFIRCSHKTLRGGGEWSCCPQEGRALWRNHPLGLLLGMEENLSDEDFVVGLEAARGGYDLSRKRRTTR